MEFAINYNKWKIIEKDSETLLKKYNEDCEDNASYAFGVCVYPEHEIWINKDMCIDQKIKTLKHELTHCYIWNNGLYNVPNFNEEMVCDLISCINDFINIVITEYREVISNG